MEKEGVSAITAGTDVLTEEQYIDLCVALSFLEEAENRLAAVYFTLDCPHEFDGIYDNYELGNIEDLRKELENTVHESERSCYRWSKRLRYILEKSREEPKRSEKRPIWIDMIGV